uniref:YEATS domain-containing protein 4-like n=1 Tax=Camelus bactrianus TaxID=9837 RepID=A0A9W3H429_CAMBA|nr:YEATS domain-containing protein 4-like [Camelus bactrianus]
MFTKSVTEMMMSHDDDENHCTATMSVFISQVTLYHLLKLFQSDTNAMLGKKTVVSEFCDEMIFQDPTAMMQQLLTTSRQLTLGAYKHETESDVASESTAQDFMQLLAVICSWHSR